MFLGSALPERDAEMPTCPGLGLGTGLGAEGAPPPGPQRASLTLSEIRPKGAGSPSGFFLPALESFRWVHIFCGGGHAALVGSITNPMCPTFPTEVSEAQRQPLAAALALPFPIETSHNEHALCPAGSRSVL